MDYDIWRSLIFSFCLCGILAQSEELDGPQELQRPSSYYECDSISSSYLLRCISPLLHSDRYRLHPPLYIGRVGNASPNGSLSDSTREKGICDYYSEYKSCAPFELRHRCRSLVSQSEQVYEHVCSNADVSSNWTSDTACLSQLDSDQGVVLCERNAATALRHIAATSAVPIEKRHTMQCDIVQRYIECARAKYVTQCGERAWMVKGEALELATDSDQLKCNFTLLEPEGPDYSKPICKENSTCACHQGYEFDSRDSSLCVDTDECSQSTDKCSQKCENTIGSYACTCDDRYYELTEDGRNCVPKSKDDKPYIFFAHGQSLWNISIDGKDFQLQRAGLQKTAMLDIHAADKMIYYVDIGANKLERIRFEGVFPQTLQSYDLEGTEGIGVDWIGRKLYSVKGANMYVQELDGRYRLTLYKDVFKLPRALAVHSPLGVCYATDWGANAFIARASMDGKDFRRIITTGLVWPNGLTIDYYSDKLYWADAYLDVIECSKLDGTQRKVVLRDTNSVPHPFGLAIMGDYLYFTDWTYRGIVRANKYNGENLTVIAQTALLPYGIKVYYPAVQPEGENPCANNNSGCSQLCLVSPTAALLSSLGNDTWNGTSAQVNHTCACADGFQSGDDERSCHSRCKAEEILCRGSDPKCIKRVFWCDSVAHCADGADEIDCPARLCFPSQFQCHINKTCIASNKICDGTKNCEDGSDEIYC